MANPYPSPTLYQYRVTQFAPPGNPSVTQNQGIYLVEFSVNSGTSWNAAFTTPFGSLHSAYEAISILVNNEAEFQQNVWAGLIPQLTHWAYPPSNPV